MIMRGLCARLPDTACLSRALALRWWMRASGIDARMKIGVRKTSGQLESHAWTEVDGHAFGEAKTVLSDFLVVDTY